MNATVNFKGGGSFVTLPPVFSSNGENVFVACKNTILQYNTKTGKKICEYKGLRKEIIGFGFHHYDSFECITACSVTGEIIVWKTITNFVIFKTSLPKHKVKTFHIIPSQNDKIKALVSRIINGNVRFSIVDVKNKNTRDVRITLEDEKYCVSVGGNKYFSVVQRNKIYFADLRDLDKVSRYDMAKNNRTFTCVACHPTEEVVLTGDNTGRAVVWQNIFSKNRSQAVFHWHTLPVNCVAFSSAGSYFYTGGSECVLVKWQMENSDEKSFLPRLSASIQHVTVSQNNAFTALATSDNAIRILDSRMQQLSLIQHLVLGKQNKSGINYDSRTRSLVMNSTTGCVQFYSPSDMSLLYNVDVVGQNKITNERECQIENTDVIKVAISKSGLWLATVEERIDVQYSGELRLKFYNFDMAKQMFELNTSIEFPHDKTINNIAFQPLENDGNLRCITVGDDKKFKIWQLVNVETIYRKGVAWKCSGAGFFRDLPCQGLSFSVDGSLIAVGFDKILTAWTPDSCDLKCTLIHPSHSEKITFVRFGYSTQCHLLVAASSHQLSVWNLLTLRMIWTVPLNRLTLLIADSLSTHMAAVTQDNKVFIFEPASPQVIYSSEGLLKNQSKIVAASFIPSKYSNDTRLKWYERSNFYFVTSENELFNISKNEELTNDYDATDEIEGKSSFGLMVPKTRKSNVKTVAPIQHLYEKDAEHKTMKKYLEAPLQTMAPIRFTCFSLLKSMVLQKESSSV